MSGRTGATELSVHAYLTRDDNDVDEGDGGRVEDVVDAQFHGVLRSTMLLALDSCHTVSTMPGNGAVSLPNFQPTSSSMRRPWSRISSCSNTLGKVVCNPVTLIQPLTNTRSQFHAASSTRRWVLPTCTCSASIGCKIVHVLVLGQCEA